MPTDKLLTGHRQFKNKFADKQEMFVRLAKEGQVPKVFWIGCSDSRVIPELITGADPGGSAPQSAIRGGRGKAGGGDSLRRRSGADASAFGDGGAGASSRRCLERGRIRSLAH